PGDRARAPPARRPHRLGAGDRRGGGGEPARRRFRADRGAGLLDRLSRALGDGRSAVPAGELHLPRAGGRSGGAAVLRQSLIPGGDRRRQPARTGPAGSASTASLPTPPSGPWTARFTAAATESGYG